VVAEHTPTDRNRRLQRLWGAAERIAQTGSWELVPSESALLWSDNLYPIFGFEPGEVQPTVEMVIAQTHPDDRARVADAVAQFSAGGELRVLTYRITRRDGELRHLRATLAVTERRDARPYRLIGVVQDVTDSRRAEREIAAHVAVEEALVEWKTIVPGANRLLAALGTALDCTAGTFWIPTGELLVARAAWQADAVEAHAAGAPRVGRELARGSGLAGRVREAGTPLGWTLGRTAIGGFPTAASNTAALTGAIAVPAIHGDEVLAVVELNSDREIKLGERLMRSLHGIAYELGHFLGRRRAELGAQLLTAREVEVLQHAATGLTARMTAERLTVSTATVRTHLENIYPKLEVSDKASAVATALRLGIIT
jgi:PAS domain S-box-containing protein